MNTNDREKCTQQYLRDMLLFPNSRHHIDNVNELLFTEPSVPYDVLDSAISDFFAALSNCFAKKDKNGKVTPFTMKPRTSNGIYSFNIPHKIIKYTHYAPKETLPDNPWIDVPGSDKKKRQRSPAETSILKKEAAIRHISVVRSARTKARKERVKGDDIISFYPTKLGKMRVRERVLTIDHDCRLSWNGRNVFKIHVPTDVDRTIKPKSTPTAMCAIDPGEVVFMTVYGTDGNVHLIGEGASKKLDRLHRIGCRLRQSYKRVMTTDNSGKKVPKRELNENGKMSSVFEQFNVSKPKRVVHNPNDTNDDVVRKTKIARNQYNKARRTRKRLANASKDYDTRFKNKQSSLHYETIKFVLKRYDKIIKPNMPVKAMVKKANFTGKPRKISKISARRLLNLGHGKFHRLFVEKGTSSRVITGTEEYTSQTCGNCLTLNPGLGGSRDFTCSHCGVKMHRDANGAHNIFLLNAGKLGLLIDGVPILPQVITKSSHCLRTDNERMKCRFKELQIVT